MPAELRPGQLLDQLFKRADTARKRDEGIRALEHHALALVHVGRDDALLHAHQHVLAVDQKLRDDPGHDPAVIDNRFGERSHQSDRATAIDQADAVLGQNSAELSRRVHESWIVAGAGGAVDANRFDCAHGHWMWPQPSGPSSRGFGMAVLERVTRGA